MPEHPQFEASDSFICEFSINSAVISAFDGTLTFIFTYLFITTAVVCLHFGQPVPKIFIAILIILYFIILSQIVDLLVKKSLSYILGVPAKKRSGFPLQSVLASEAWQSVECISSKIRNAGIFTSIPNAAHCQNKI